MSIPPQGNSATAIVEAGTAVAGASANTVLYVDAAGLLASEAAFTYNESTDTLTALNIVASTTLKASNLTATRIPYATTGGQFTDDSSFTFTAASDLVTVDKLTVSTGPLIIQDGSGAAPALRNANYTTTGLYWGAGPLLGFAVGGGTWMSLDGNGVLFYQKLAPGSDGGVDLGASALRFNALYVQGIGGDGDDIWAQRNGTTTQETRVYRRYTSATNFSRCQIKSSSVTSSAVSGASVTVTGVIPAAVAPHNVIGITTKILTALGTGNGTSGYTVGYGADADMFGTASGVATTVSTKTPTANPLITWNAAAQDIVLTATGGNFDGTGAIETTVFYIEADAD